MGRSGDGNETFYWDGLTRMVLSSKILGLNYGAPLLGLAKSILVRYDAS